VQDNAQGAEQRGLPRLEKRLFVRYGIGNLDHTGLSYDLSPIGIFIQSSCVFRLRARLNIELSLPNDLMLHCRGQVIWVKRITPDTARLNEKQGMGIHLIAPPESYITFVKGLQEHAEESPRPCGLE